nr:serine/threonine-protein kinase [Cellulomonas sp. APG4]
MHGAPARAGVGGDGHATCTDEEADVVPGLEIARGVVLDGRYRIEGVLGHGGMSTVYRAHDEVLERDVALKIFPPTPDADEVRRHHAEMRVLAQLSHPGLVTLHDAGSARTGESVVQTYLVMELVPGPTLADLLATGPLAARHAARVGRQLAEALAAVHDAGVVHRDIKPANVLLVAPRDREDPEDALATGPVVKIADFGIARLADAARMTVTGTTLGTATYLSPEQAAGTEVGAATDVYALGLVLLECLTGEKAFTGTVVEVAAARLTSSPRIPSALGRPWCELLGAMTSTDPGARPTMAEVAEGLRVLAGEPRRAPVEDDGDVVTAAHPAVGVPVRTSGEDVSTAGLEIPPQRPREPSVDTRRLPPDVIRARAASAPTGEEPGGPQGPHGRAVVLWLAAAVLVVVLGVLLGRPAGQPEGEVPDLPEVGGTLGDALDELARSVTP